MKNRLREEESVRESEELNSKSFYSTENKKGREGKGGAAGLRKEQKETHLVKIHTSTV